MRIAGYRVRNTIRDKMQGAACTSSTPNSTLHTPNSKGFTLIEAIITIVIVGIISSIAALIILEGMKAISKEQNLSGVHYQARIAMERMGREIRLIRWNTTLAQADVTTMTATDLIFCDVTGKAVEFQLAGSVLNRRESATCSPLAWGGWNTLSSSGVNPLTFSYLDSTGAGGATAANLWFVDINLTDTQGSDSLQMRSRVHPRNF